MKRQRMHKSGCSMLVAALIGLLPIAAGHAQDTGRTFGQEPETGTMGSQGSLRDMDEVQLQGPEQGAQGPRREDAVDTTPASHDIRDPETRQDMDSQFHGSGARGAQGPLREDTGMDADAARDRDMDVRGAEGPFRQDTDLDEQTGEQLESDTTGAEGPLRQDTELDSDAAQDSDTSGAAGPLRQDTDLDADTAEEMDSDASGAEGPSRFDTEMDSDAGAEGQLRPDTELDSDTGAEGPVRDDAGTASPQSGGATDEGAQGSLWQDRDTVRRERLQQDGSQGPMRQDTMQQPSEFDARGAEGPVPADAASGEALDEPGAQGPMGQETDSGLQYQPSQEPPRQAVDMGGAQGPLRADTAPRSYRMYMGETNPYIDPGNIVTIPYSEAGVAGARGPLRDDGLPANLGPTHTETNPFIDKGGGNVRTDVPARDQRGAQGPLRTDDLEAVAPSRDLDMEMRFHNYIGETNPLIDPDGVKTQPYRSGAFTSVFRRDR